MDKRNNDKNYCESRIKHRWSSIRIMRVHPHIFGYILIIKERQLLREFITTHWKSICWKLAFRTSRNTRTTLDDYQRDDLFGFIIASFFLSLLKGYSDRDILEVASIELVERGKLIEAGDEMSKILADMLLHLNDLGCLKYFHVR